MPNSREHSTRTSATDVRELVSMTIVRTVLTGRLWITEEACNDDVWLEAGQHANLSGDGLAVIESVGASRVEIH